MAALLCETSATLLLARASQETYYQGQVHPVLKALHWLHWVKAQKLYKGVDREQGSQKLLHVAVAAAVALCLPSWA